MGGWGSGGRNRTHGTVEQYSRIDSFELGRYMNEADDEDDGEHAVRDEESAVLRVAQ